MLKPEELSRYGRQIILPKFGKEGQQRLKDAKVLIVGAGGLGMPLLQYLAAAGIGRIGVVEHDDVHESNLHRQILYTNGDIGRKKGKIVKERLQKLNPHTHCELHLEKLTEANAEKLIADYDLVADGSDNFATKYLVNDTCVKLGKPLVYGAVLAYQGQLSVFNLPDKRGKFGPNYRDLFPEAPDNTPDCAEAGVLGVLPGIIGSLMALEVLKVVAQLGEPLSGRVLNFDGLSHRFSTIDLGLEPKAKPKPKQSEVAPPQALDPAVVQAAADESERLRQAVQAEMQAEQNGNRKPVSYEEITLKPELFTGKEKWEAANGEQEAAKEVPAAVQMAMASRQVRTVSPKELEEWADKERVFSLIDVREPNEHDLVNIGGRLIPFSKLEANMSRFRPDQTYVLYCKTGARSEKAAELLLLHGIPEVYNLEGGILRYIAEVAPEMPTY